MGDSLSHLDDLVSCINRITRFIGYHLKRKNCQINKYCAIDLLPGIVHHIQDGGQPAF